MAQVIYIYICIYVCVYIYIERERDPPSDPSADCCFLGLILLLSCFCYDPSADRARLISIGTNYGVINCGRLSKDQSNHIILALLRIGLVIVRSKIDYI